jgi:hypothetical protein
MPNILRKRKKSCLISISEEQLLNPENLKTSAKEIAMRINTEKDLSDFASELVKIVVEAALNVADKPFEI